MKCRVCSQETPGAARLCANCTAAMKRAREVLTVDSTPVARSNTPGPWNLLRRRRDALWIGVGVLVTVTAAAYLGQRDRNDSLLEAAPASAFIQVETPSQVTTMPGTAPASEPAIHQAEAFKSTRAAPMTAAVTTEGPLMAATLSSAKPVQKLAVQKTAPPAPLPLVSVVPTKPNAGSSALTETKETTSSRVATASLPKASDPQDRAQALTHALGRCGAEGFFTRVACEERARLQYCDGAWGSVAQCPVSRRSENTP